MRARSRGRLRRARELGRVVGRARAGDLAAELGAAIEMTRALVIGAPARERARLTRAHHAARRAAERRAWRGLAAPVRRDRARLQLQDAAARLPAGWPVQLALGREGARLVRALDGRRVGARYLAELDRAAEVKRRAARYFRPGALADQIAGPAARARDPWPGILARARGGRQDRGP